MSFVDLMGNDRWTEADIVNRTEAILRSSFSAQEETIINRKLSGQQLGQYTMTTDERAELAAFSAATLQAKADGASARADAALVNAALDVEQGLVDPSTVSAAVTSLLGQRSSYRASLTPSVPPDPIPLDPPPAAA